MWRGSSCQRNDNTGQRLSCRECDKIEELPLKIMVSGAVISCSECGSLIVETKSN